MSTDFGRSLALIVQAVFLLERGQTDRQTNRKTRLNAVAHASGYAIQPEWVN